jgi:hypothetical protein
MVSVTEAPVETRVEAQDTTPAQNAPVVETDLLIIGTGPAGASLACFLTQHGQCGKSLHEYRLESNFNS